MARSSSEFPARVVAIAVVIAVLLGGLIWLTSGLGAPAEPVPATGAPSAEEEPLVAAAEELPPEASLPEAAASVDAEVTIRLYLVQGATRELVPRVRRVRAPDHPAARAQLALQALINAGEPGYVSPLPPTTTIREVWVDVEAGVAYVDLARGFEALLGGGSLSEIHAAYGMVGTLTGSFPGIARVQFLVEGRPVDSFTGHLDLSLPLARSSDWLY